MRRVFAVTVSLVIIGGAAAFLAWYLYQPTCTVTGTITRDGKPLEWKTEAGQLVVIFVPLEDDLNRYRAQETNRDGTYTLRGIPAGSYRVSIQQMDPDTRFDLLGFALDIKGSKIEREVASTVQVIDINIPKDLRSKEK